MDSWRVALVGAGSHCSENILPALTLLPGTEVAAVTTATTATAAAAASTWGIPAWYDDYETMIDNEEPSAIITIGPPKLHTEVASTAVSSGIDVFTDKPLSLSTSDVNRLAALSSENAAVTTFVGQNFRFASMMQEAIRLAQNDGPIRATRIVIRSNKPTSPMWEMTSTFASFMFAVGIHAVDLAVALLGQVTETTAVRQSTGASTFAVTANSLHEQGTSAIWLSNGSNSFGFEAEIVTDEASFTVTNLDTMLIRTTKPHQYHPKEVTEITTSGLKGGFDRSGYQTQLAAFRRSCASREESPSSFGLARKTSAAVAQLIESVNP